MCSLSVQDQQPPLKLKQQDACMYISHLCTNKSFVSEIKENNKPSGKTKEK